MAIITSGIISSTNEDFPAQTDFHDVHGNLLATSTIQVPGDEWRVFRNEWKDGMSYLRAIDIHSEDAAHFLAAAIRAEMTAFGI